VSDVTIDGVAEAIIWYSVERLLPDVMTTVMVASNDDSYPTFPGYWDDDAGSWFSIHEQKLDGVTHWADMPAGPT
jgi:hypothetical protein